MTGRTDGDSWDLAIQRGSDGDHGRGGPRRWPRRDPSRCSTIPLADPLVRAVGLDPFIRIIDGEIDLEDDPLLNRKARTEQMTVRTRFFDDFFTGRDRQAGIRQAVILASGLDTRAYRLRWPDGHGGLRDRPAAGHRIQNATRWPASAPPRPPTAARSASICARTGRRRCGTAVLTSTSPTAWSAEGLLPYLPPEAQDRLFDNITALSAPGSRLATEHVPDPNAFSDERLQQHQRAMAAASASTSTRPTCSTGASATSSSTT